MLILVIDLNLNTQNIQQQHCNHYFPQICLSLKTSIPQQFCFPGSYQGGLDYLTTLFSRFVSGRSRLPNNSVFSGSYQGDLDYLTTLFPGSYQGGLDYLTTLFPGSYQGDLDYLTTLFLRFVSGRSRLPNNSVFQVRIREV